MYAISHAATALVLTRRYPDASLWPLLIAIRGAATGADSRVTGTLLLSSGLH